MDGLSISENERIVCNFNITVTKYDQSSNKFTCNALIQANRPVYNSAYNTTLYNNKDNDFNFEFAQFDQLNFNEEQIDNQLTALFAYYAYLIIGLNLDSFSPMGGEDILQRCMNLTNNAQNLNFTGWKSFETDRNRFAIINDYLDGAMKLKPDNCSMTTTELDSTKWQTMWNAEGRTSPRLSKPISRRLMTTSR